MINAIKPVLFVLAVAYFTVDAVFMSVARPLARWLAERPLLNDVRAWIVSLRPYPTLAIFVVPFIILEPVKFVAAYLIGTGSFWAGATVLVVGEILKLVLIERLFEINREKLLSIPAFAWCYDQWRWAIDSLQATEMFRHAREVMAFTRLFIGNAMRGARSLSAQNTRRRHIRGSQGRAAYQPTAYGNALHPIPIRAARPGRRY